MATSITQLRGAVRPTDWEQRVVSMEHRSRAVRSGCRDARSLAQQDELDVSAQGRWAAHLSQVDLARRIEELKGLRRTFDQCLNAVVLEKQAMEQMLNATEHGQDDLRTLANVIKECRVQRDERHLTDLVDDEVQEELAQSQSLTTSNQHALQDQCSSIRSHVQELIRVQHQLEKAMGCVDSTLELDRDQLALNTRSANVSLKPDPTREPSGTMSLQCWEQRACRTLNEAEDALRRCRALAEDVANHDTRLNQDVASSRESVAYALRKRIHVEQQVVARLQHEHDSLSREVKRLSRDTGNVERLTDATLVPLRLTHTRLENRAARCRLQLCHDHAQESLVREAGVWADSHDALARRAGDTRTTLHDLCRQFDDVTKELNHKRMSLRVDQRCLDTWQRFKERPGAVDGEDEDFSAPYLANLPVPLATRPSLGWVAPW